MRERDHWGDPSVDGRIILRRIFRKLDVGLWTGLGWLRIETGGGHLWMRYWTFGFHKMRGIS
jgi:accessory gene regulator protein AgrB